jgi:hypothetical protein
MDWKPYYRSEIDSAAGRRAVDGLLRAPYDEAIARAIAGGAIVSFPHTALAYAGPLQAWVVSSLYRSGVERVIALGVLHSGTSVACRTSLDETRSLATRRAALAEVEGGTLLPPEAIETPFGDLPIVVVAEDVRVPVRIDRGGGLADEFSLDTFFALMRRAADLRGVGPLPVLPIFVGPTRDPIGGSFAVAERLSNWIRSICAVDERPTAIVATGDLVHFGTAYGAPDADPSRSAEDLEALFCLEVDRVLTAALTARDWDLAHRQSNDVLRNDQREILPVISGILGPAEHRVVHFELSDYARILDSPPPCYVASALAVYDRLRHGVNGN